jgi:hypothetical protein
MTPLLGQVAWRWGEVLSGFVVSFVRFSTAGGPRAGRARRRTFKSTFEQLTFNAQTAEPLRAHWL